MVQQARKTYKPHVKIVDAVRGRYTVQSERYTYILYGVAVRADGQTTCECTAGSFGRDCKHQRAVAAYVAYRARPSHIRPAAPSFAELAAPAPAFDFRRAA